ncbi:hypothetical protein GGS21DRAFT_491412 [Xylaria nigripes]|nr:hypothetical protein GGS21DRAFT_491412 [Xylaria nigripes]
MASPEDQSSLHTSTSTPHVKFEPSLVESFLPGDVYAPLFTTPPTPSSTIENMMSPESLVADENTPNVTSPQTATSTETEKKPVKKRKSWGQVLPEPKTNLPPRKRAKTEDEKEQRRVERVLRNRRAAQSSRERKRQEVEALEQRNAALEAALLEQQKQCMVLMEEVSQLRRNVGVVSRSASPLDAFQPSPLTLSQPLFPPSPGASPQPPSGAMEDFILMPEQDATVNPASISPGLNPVADSDIKTASTNPAAKTEPVTVLGAVASSDETQHPAAVLCDLQCPADFSLLPTSDADSWGLEEQFSPSTDPLNFEYDHLAGDAAPELPEFDINQFLSDDVSGAPSGTSAVHDPLAQESDLHCSFFDFENQIPTETFNQQPHFGASAHGCDDEVLAVGD